MEDICVSVLLVPMVTLTLVAEILMNVSLIRVDKMRDVIMKLGSSDANVLKDSTEIRKFDAETLMNVNKIHVARTPNAPTLKAVINAPASQASQETLSQAVLTWTNVPRRTIPAVRTLFAEIPTQALPANALQATQEMVTQAVKLLKSEPYVRATLIVPTTLSAKKANVFVDLGSLLSAPSVSTLMSVPAVDLPYVVPMRFVATPWAVSHAPV
jgi:glutamyl/glutaminyl-tRNA synthetase